MRPGTRCQAPGVRADQAGTGGRGDLGEPRVGPGPGVVEQVGPGRYRLPGHLGPPGVDRDHHVGELGAHRGDGGDGPADLLRRVDGIPGSGLDPADVDDVRALGDRLLDRAQRGVRREGRAPVVERVRGPVDDRHQGVLARPEGTATQSQHTGPIS